MSNSDIIVEAQGLTKIFRIWSSPRARLQHPLLNAIGAIFPFSRFGLKNPKHRSRDLYREFYAVRGISFQLRRGESLGVVGRNGAGKSTLLQMVVGTLAPTMGKISTRGRVSALLELGSGFNPDFTGRENIYLNGAVLGLTNREVDDLFEEIVEFADIGAFLDEPVKSYSSGMVVRLAFAVAVAVKPDLLIVDEALSVGDLFFQQKCFRKIREFQAQGVAVCLVTHDLAAMQNLCDRALLLHHGEVAYDGEPEACASRYHSIHRAEIKGRKIDLDDGATLMSPAESLRQSLIDHDISQDAKSRHGNEKLRILAVNICNEEEEHTLSVRCHQSMKVKVLLKAEESVAHPAAGVLLFDRMANLVFAAGTPQKSVDMPSMKAGQELVLQFRIAMNLSPEQYSIGVDASEFDPADPDHGDFSDRITGLGPVSVLSEASEHRTFFGMTDLPMEIEIQV